MDVALTNLRLYAQLAQSGWSNDDLVRVRDAYELDLGLFSGRLRPDGNTFIAHLVGTASLCASYGGRPDVVLAGLMHAAYSAADYGDTRRVLNDGQRCVVRATIGENSERLVYEFRRMGWTPAFVADLDARVDDLSAIERDLALIRLANEIEQQSDRGAQYRSARTDYPTMEAMISLAERLHWAEIGHDLRAAVAADAELRIPAVLVRDDAAPRFLAPRSYRPRRILAFGRLLQGARRRVLRLAHRVGRV